MLNEEKVDQLVALEAKRAIDDGTRIRAGREVPNAVQMRELALTVFQNAPPENSDGSGVGFTRSEAGHTAFDGYPEIGADASPEAKAAKTRLEALIWGIASPRRLSALNEMLRANQSPKRVIQYKGHRGVNPVVLRRLSESAADLQEHVVGSAVDKVVKGLDEALAIRDDVVKNYPELEVPVANMIRERLAPMLPSGTHPGAQ